MNAMKNMIAYSKRVISNPHRSGDATLTKLQEGKLPKIKMERPYQKKSSFVESKMTL